MQGDVRGEDARAFASALYRELLVEGRDIDAAVAFARSRIEDFGFRCLTLHQRPDTVLPLPPWTWSRPACAGRT
jgi:hypothetical protein